MSIPEDVLNGWVVLVVDDEPDSAEVASMLLEMYGARVITASNGREALEMIKKHHPRFVITDLTMPEMTGWEMTKMLKLDDRRAAAIPVVALTAHAMVGDRSRALAMGFHYYLTKPLDPETFVPQVINMLADELPELKIFVEQANGK